MRAASFGSVIVIVACGSPAKPAEAPLSSRAPEPQGVQILLDDLGHPSSLVVTDDRLYWISALAVPIHTAPLAGGAVVDIDDTEAAGYLMVSDGRLVFRQKLSEVHTMPLTGHVAGAIATVPGHISSLVEHHGIVAATFDDQLARVLAVSDSGGVTELARWSDAVAPLLAVGGGGELFVGWDVPFSSKATTSLARIDHGQLVPLHAPPGVSAIAANGADVYAVTSSHGGPDVLVRTNASAAQATVLYTETIGHISAIVADERYVYWSVSPLDGSDAAGGIWRLANTTTASPERVATVGGATDLVLHGPDLYWADYLNGQIARIRR